MLGRSPPPRCCFLLVVVADGGPGATGGASSRPRARPAHGRRCARGRDRPREIYAATIQAVRPLAGRDAACSAVDRRSDEAPTTVASSRRPQGTSRAWARRLAADLRVDHAERTALARPATQRRRELRAESADELASSRAYLKLTCSRTLFSGRASVLVVVGELAGCRRPRGDALEALWPPGRPRPRERRAHRGPPAPPERGTVRLARAELLRRRHHRARRATRRQVHEPVGRAGPRLRRRRARGHAVHGPHRTPTTSARAALPHAGAARGRRRTRLIECRMRHHDGLLAPRRDAAHQPARTTST